MKVDGPKKTGSSKAASKVGAKGKPGDSSFSGMIDRSEAPEAASGTTATSSVMQIDALLSLQEAGDGTSGSGRRQAQDRAEILLDQLDKIKIGLLTGGIPLGSLQQLSQTISQRRENVADPRLSSLLDEIDLRVQVELAKHSR